MDELESSHPIVNEETEIGKILSFFDEISYNKGAAIIRMMEKFITADTFRFLASQDALEVMLVSQSVSQSVTLRTKLTDVALVSEDIN